MKNYRKSLITKTVPGFPDYEVSACGRVFSNRTSRRKEMRGNILPKGYRRFSLYTIAGLYQPHDGHRLVAMAWLPSYDPSLEVNHIDGNKLNNHASNLEMVTSSQNQRSFRAKNSNNTLGFAGIEILKRLTKTSWRGKVKAMGKQYNTKCFPTREQAAFARDVLALSHGFTKEALNFPENYNRYMWELNSQQTLKI